MNELSLLGLTAFNIALFHTILGPDHYVPFVALAKARKWSLKQLLPITLISGVAHILSSVLLGFVGIWLGSELMRLEVIESFRGDLAGWFLVLFGAAYSIYGILQVGKHRKQHEEGIVHHHGPIRGKSGQVTPWILFIIFLFGPCEPLIPLLMYPAAKLNGASVLLVSLIFGLTTLVTMTVMVLILYFGINKVSLPSLEKYSHALAGFAVLICGVSITFLGL